MSHLLKLKLSSLTNTSSLIGLNLKYLKSYKIQRGKRIIIIISINYITLNDKMKDKSAS